HLLHHRWREAARMVMVLLSAGGLTADEIGELLDYHPATVRRWIHRYNTDGAPSLADRPGRGGRPGPGLGERICRLLARPGPWTIRRIHRRLGRPKISSRTVHRRTRERAAWRRPRLTAPRGTPTAGASWPPCAGTCGPCRPGRWPWPRTRPTCTCCRTSGRAGSRGERGSRRPPRARTGRP